MVIKLGKTKPALAKFTFEEIPNLYYTQLNYIIENTFGVQNPVCVLKIFNLSPMEIIEILTHIQ